MPYGDVQRARMSTSALPLQHTIPAEVMWVGMPALMGLYSLMINFLDH